MEDFKASVQYDDWKGTVAADDGHETDLQTVLREKGIIDDKSYIVAIRLYTGENSEKPSVRAVIADGTGHDDVNAQITSTDTLRFKEVDIDISLSDFFGLFKRFNIVLTSRDLGLDGREYNVIQS